MLTTQEAIICSLEAMATIPSLGALVAMIRTIWALLAKIRSMGVKVMICCLSITPILHKESQQISMLLLTLDQLQQARIWLATKISND